jgi:hypothetical protein
MKSLASGGPLARVGMAIFATLACAQFAAAVESAKTPEEAFKESLKTGKPILAVLGSET